MKLHKKDFCRYYKQYKELSLIHQKLFISKARPNIPALYSESLCRFLFNMQKSNNKEYDAVLDDNQIEIKATSSKSGTTSINPYSKFDILYWLYFEVGKDCLSVTKIPYGNFEEAFSDIDIKKDKEQKLRMNISLKEFAEGCKVDYFNLITLEKTDAKA